MSESITEPHDPDIGDAETGDIPDAALDPQQTPDADLSGDPIGADL
jgi:hypothetical protein